MHNDSTAAAIEPATAPSRDSIAAKINAAHLACKAAVGQSLNHAIQAGHLLIEAKAGCQHGEWSQWLADHFHGSKRSAQVYMRLAARADELESKSAESAHLSIQQALEAITPAKANPPLSIAERNAGMVRALRMERAIGSILNYGATLGIPDVHRLRWLYPSQGFISWDQLGEAILEIPQPDFDVLMEGCRSFDCAEDDPDWQPSVDSITGAITAFAGSDANG